MSNIITKKTDSYSLKVDMALGYEIYKLKVEKGKSPHNVHLPNHPLTNKKIFDNHEQEESNIEGVYKHWYGGWYLVLLTEKNKSHGLVIFKNINCINPDILGFIEEAKYRYTILE